jgi:hypothetical protein
MYALCAIAVLVLASPAWADGGGATYESYYRFLGDYPGDEEPDWSDNVQGVTHDQDNWYITQTQRLWRIPVGLDLEDVTTSSPGVAYLDMSSTELPSLGYNHIGDLDYSQGYLFVPLEGSGQSGLAVFRPTAAGFDYIGYGLLNQQAEGANAAWIALDPNNPSDVYTSNWGYVHTIQKYHLDWDRLRNENRVVVTYVPGSDITLWDQSGAQAFVIDVQGGAFSPTSRLLYLSAGYTIGFWCDGEDYDGDWMAQNGGIHVFDTSSPRTWTRIRKSANCSDCSDIFRYEFGPTLTGGCDEPEGLTFWDLDQGRAPGIRGQLHVLLLENDLDADDIFFKHYTGVVYVDERHFGDGTRGSPYHTVTEAHSFAWNGSRIKIHAGSYVEPLTFFKQIRLLAWEGTATMGNEGRISLAPSASIDLSGNGMLRLR